MKCIILADLHLGIHKDDPIWLDQSEDLFKQIRDTAIREDIKTIFVLGDLFHERKLVNVSTLYRSYKLMQLWSEFNVILVIGNHDTYFKNQVNPNILEIYKGLPNIDIIEDMTEMEDITILPWTTEKLDIESIKTKYLFTHIEIGGFPATYKSDFIGGYNVKEFSHFDLVVSGHFHIPSKRKNVLYCGAPFHLAFSDKDSICGYYIFDEGKIKFIKNEKYSSYVRISSEDTPSRDLIEGNIVSINFVKDYGILGNNRKIEYLQSLQPLRLFPDFTNVSLVDDIEVEEGDPKTKIKSNKVILTDYLDMVDVPTYINKDTLLSIVGNLVPQYMSE